MLKDVLRQQQPARACAYYDGDEFYIDQLHQTQFYMSFTSDYNYNGFFMAGPGLRRIQASGAISMLCLAQDQIATAA
jgi:hypothetical protein